MILFIIGPSGTGKTYIRKEIFPDCKYVDVFEYQQKWRKGPGSPFENMCKADEEAITDFEELVKNKKEDEIVIFESTLASSERRKNYVARVREAIPEGVNESVCCMVMKPEEKDCLFLQTKKEEEAGVDVNDKDEKKRIKAYARSALEYQEYYQSFEGEGFDSIYAVIPIIRE